MKKFLLVGISLFVLAASKSSFAQSFSIPKDTVRYLVQNTGFPEEISTYIQNETSAPINVTWKIVNHNMPASWISPFGLCDNVTCYLNSVVGTPGSAQLTDTFSNTCPLKIQMNFTNADKGGHFVTVQLNEGTTTDSVTFVVEKFGVGINSVKASADGISLYPNPAHDELNVRFNASSAISYITVYNMIGKALTAYKVTAPNSAKLNIENIPAGIYFIRLSDTHGRIVATRKFTRQ